MSIKDQRFLYSYIYNDNKHIYKLIQNAKWKENVYTFFIKKNNFINGFGWTATHLATAMSLTINNSVWCLKNQGTFFTE